MNFKEFVESHLQESKSDFRVYHNSYTSAIEEVIEYIKKNGYGYSEDEFFDTVSVGPKKPSVGKTNRFSIQLYKGGIETKKYVHFQIYGGETNYELNVYIS